MVPVKDSIYKYIKNKDGKPISVSLSEIILKEIATGLPIKKFDTLKEYNEFYK